MLKKFAVVCVVFLILTGCASSAKTTLPKAKKVAPGSLPQPVLPTVFVDDGPGLREAAETRNLYFGTAIRPGRLNQKWYSGTLKRNFNMMTAEDAMKWQSIHPEPNKFNFEKPDKMIEFAEENNMKVRGHTLIWHNQLAKWVSSPAEMWTRDELIEVMREHINAVAGRYKGKIYAWDVVNEAIDGSNYRHSLFYDVIGPEYIAMAFRMAHEADPDALLYYNDYGVSEIGAKSDAMYVMVKELLADGVPIHGVGFQTHMSLQWEFSFESFRSNIARFVDLGLKVDLTEVDIRIEMPASEDELAEQARRYAKLIDVFLEFPTCDSFVIWGISDSSSWIPYTFNNMGAATIFDEEYQAKPAFFSIRNALINGPLEDGTEKRDITQATRRPVPPFIAKEAETQPVIDGKITASEWDNGIIYPLGFNQLSSKDLTIAESISGTWTVVYKGNTVYGLLTREDDVTYIGDSSSWENDTLEVFFDLNGTFSQLRTLVGQGFQDTSYGGEYKAVWSSDGSICEFSVELPDTDLANMLCGWNIALSDNDGGGRVAQLYPVNGINNSYQGANLGSLKFEGTSPKPPEAARIVYPFRAMPVNTISVDGKFSESEWGSVITYPFLFNQLSADNLVPPENTNDISGSWGIAYDGTVLYGFVKRTDDITYTDASNSYENDCVEVFLDAADAFVQLRTLVGADWEDSPMEGARKAVWSNDGSLLEFEIEMTEDAFAEGIIGFNIALADNDGDGREVQLYPVFGFNDSYKGINLAELELVQ